MLTLIVAVRMTKEQSNAVAMGKFTIAASAMDTAWGSIGFSANMQRGYRHQGG